MSGSYSCRRAHPVAAQVRREHAVRDRGERRRIAYAESSAKAGGQIAPASPSTIIRRTSDGSIVATVDAAYGVLAFSGTTRSRWSPRHHGRGVESKRRSPRCLHRQHFLAYWGARVVQLPGPTWRQAFVLFFKQVGNQSLHPPVDVYLVGTPSRTGICRTATSSLSRFSRPCSASRHLHE